MKTAATLLILLAASAVGAADRAPTRNQSYAAIAYYGPNNVGWSTDRKSAREAKIEALKQCGSERCEVVASITRGCGALAGSTDKFAVQKGATRNEAETKALRRCGAQCQVLAWACTR